MNAQKIVGYSTLTTTQQVLKQFLTREKTLELATKTIQHLDSSRRST